MDAIEMKRSISTNDFMFKWIIKIKRLRLYALQALQHYEKIVKIKAKNGLNLARFKTLLYLI